MLISMTARWISSSLAPVATCTFSMLTSLPITCSMSSVSSSRPPPTDGLISRSSSLIASSVQDSVARPMKLGVLGQGLLFQRCELCVGGSDCLLIAFARTLTGAGFRLLQPGDGGVHSLELRLEVCLLDPEKPRGLVLGNADLVRR